MRVFISFHYGTFTSTVASEIREDLSRYEIDAWSFHEASKGGCVVTEEYEQRVRQSDAVIVLWDEGARQSEHVLAELKLAASSSKRIIPVCFDEAPLPLDLATLSCISHKGAHDRNKLVEQLLRALERQRRFQINDKFWGSRVRWKTYTHPPEAFPLCGRDDSLLLVATRESRMSIQSESEGTYGTLRVVARSGWRTDTSVGLEKWVDHRRYSVRVQGNGTATVERGRLGPWAAILGSATSFPVHEWTSIKKDAIDIRFTWSKKQITIRVNGRIVCDIATSIHVPLRIRLNADVSDSISVIDAEWPTWSTS